MAGSRKWVCVQLLRWSQDGFGRTLSTSRSQLVIEPLKSNPPSSVLPNEWPKSLPTPGVRKRPKNGEKLLRILTIPSSRRGRRPVCLEKTRFRFPGE